MDLVTWRQRYEAGNIGSRTVKLTDGSKCDTIGLIKIYLRLRNLKNGFDIGLMQIGRNHVRMTGDY